MRVRRRHQLLLLLTAAALIFVYTFEALNINGDDPFDYFDEIMVVTVPARHLRVIKLLRQIGLDTRAKILAAKMKPESDADWQLLRNSNSFQVDTLSQLTAGEVAVSLSQRDALSRFLNNSNAHNALILEDDFTINGDALKERLNYSLPVLEAASNPWDILFLGRCHDHCEYDQYLGADVYQVFNPVCLHAYAINRRAAKMIIEAARLCKGSNCPIDNVVRSLIQGTSELGRSQMLVALAISPQLFTQETSFRGNLSLVQVDKADESRMQVEADIATRTKRTGDDLAECMRHHERVLVSNYNLWRDPAGRKPSPRELRWQQDGKEKNLRRTN